METTENNQMINNLEAMLAQGQDNALLRYSLGHTYLKIKQFERAQTHLAQALAFDAQYSAAWKSYAQALELNNQLQQAIEAYTQGIAVAEHKGDKQVAKEMNVFLKRLQKRQGSSA